MSPTLLLSDLHLPAAPSPLRQAFQRLLEGPAREAAAMYILGDLFEYWIGDDAGLREYAPEVAALRALSERGVQVFFMRGNRDFLAGEGFSRASGVQLLEDPAVIELGGHATLLSHGDAWCLDDRAYQRWRRFSRKWLTQALYLSLPLRLRQGIAGQARGRSAAGKALKPDAIMDVSEAAIREAFRRHAVTRIVHGHTHRPARHLYDLDGRRAERIVLADWTAGRMEYLRSDQSGLQGCAVPA
jgi:UDP-2,3-diacylglucosamine hydrolase